MEWLKVLGRKLFAPFLTLPASFSSSVGSWVWIFSKPSVTENCCQFFLAPNSYCGLGTSTRKITTLISSTAAAPWCSLCLLWPGRLLRVIQRQHRSPARAWNTGRVKAACRQLSHPHPLPSYTWEGILEITPYMLYLLQERRVFQSHVCEYADQHSPRFYNVKGKLQL